MITVKKHFHRRSRMLWVALFAALAMLLGAQSCTPATPTQKVPTPIPGPLPGEESPPRIDVPGFQEKDRRSISDRIKPEALPEGAHAVFPAFDGDMLFVTLPVREQADVSAKQVLEEVIQPILAATGFERGLDALALPPDSGIQMPVADFHGLAQAVAFEFDNNPEARRPESGELVEAFLSERASDDIDQALQLGEGMTLAQFIAGIERLEIQFVFQQVDNGVPIEHTLLLASRWADQSITSVRGMLINNYSISNKVTIKAEEAGQIAMKALAQVKGVEKVTSETVEDGPYLVLLPYSADASEVTLRYAYRMILVGVSSKQQGRFILWLDAETGEILKLEPLFRDVSAEGIVYNRDPGIGTTSSFFEVDPSAGGQYTLQLTGVMNRVDNMGDGNPANDLSITDSTNGSSATFANFDQAPVNDPAQAMCASGTNKGFQQVNFFATIYRYRQESLSLGIFTPFPRMGGLTTDPSIPWSPQVEKAGYCNANAGMVYGACTGYFDAACPNYSTGDTNGENFMNFAHDNTVVGHELAHSITPRFTLARPSDWCGMAVCSIPIGWYNFHDLADAWADHLESTNCTAGWVSKNMNGVNASLNCLLSDEGGYLPRLHQVTAPFNPATPGDHFPEHRSLATGDYADGQIGAAALWQVRIGMRSKCRWSGIPQFGVRFARALKETGFMGFAPSSTDTGLYRQLNDLLFEMIDQWALAGSPTGPPAFIHNGSHTTNKVTAGFARTGLFLIPYQCLDGDPTTGDPTSCPVASGGENGGDAVIDIDDNDPADDYTINGVSHPEIDFLELGGPAPTFSVWTGPRYRLDGAGGASTITNPSPCNTQYLVEVSTDPAFAPGATVDSGWNNVDTNPGSAPTPECYDTWTPSAAQWTTLQAGGALSRIYYRVTTRDDSSGNLRVSTMPGNGLWTVPAPYAVITADGQSDY